MAMQGFLLAIFFSGAFPAAVRGAEFLCAGISAPLLQTDGRAKPAVFRGFPSEGQVRAAVIFATFAGEEAVLPAYAADLFRPEVPGSLSHFYRAMSFGRLILTGVILPRVYLASKGASAYMEIREEERPRDFALEVIQQVDREVDFGRYDSDGPDGVPNSGDDDGVVDCVFLNLLTMPAGFLRGPATGMASLGFDEYLTDDPAAEGGPIRIRGRRGTLQRVTGFSYAVGSMAHEFGHLLGLPDLYDTEGDTPAAESAGVGAWCLMGRGALGWSGEDGPNPFCAWCREQLGWVGGIVDVWEPLSEVAMGDVETGGAVYRIPITWKGERPEEYFLLENRQRSNGFYDRGIPGEGLLIWHVVKGGNNDEEGGKLVDLECADGRFADRGWPDGKIPDPERGGDNLDFWSRDEAYRLAHAGNEGDATDPFDGERFTSFTPNTNPKSRGEMVEVRAAVIGPSVTRIRKQGNGVMLADIAPPQWAGQILNSGREGSGVVWKGTVELVGDLVIGEGAALGIAPGTVVRVAAGDLLHGGEDPERVEIMVRGVLRSFGAPSTPVVFTGPDWHGIRWEQGNSYFFFNRAANRLEGAQVGLSLGREPFPTEGVHLISSSFPQTLAPGERVSFQVGLWNAAAEPLSVRVKGVIEDPFVRALSTADYTTVIPPGGVDRSRILLLTIASEAPEGREIALIARVVTGAGEIVEDTLRATIVGRDTTPPEISYGWQYPSKVRVGTLFTMYVRAWEPGPLEAVTAYILEEEAILDSLPLFRRGVEGDQRNTSLLNPLRDYRISWTPSREMDFQISVTAIDAAGNTWQGLVTESVAARPYQRTADLLLWGPRVRIVTYENILAEAGLTADTWEIEEGAISASVLDLYRAQPPGVVVWLGPSTLEESIQQLNAFLSAGGRLLAAPVWLGGALPNSLPLQVFLGDFARAALVTTLFQEGQIRGVPGDPIGGGLAFRVPSYDEYAPTSGAQAMLSDAAGKATGLRVDGGTYRLVLLGFDPLRMSPPEVRGTLFQRAIQWLAGAMGSGDWDIGLGPILAPDGSGLRSFRPAVTLFTRGAVPAQEVAIRCLIRDEAGQAVYADTQQVDIGSQVQETEVAFRAWTPERFGAYRLRTELVSQGDVDPANDWNELNTQIAPMVDVAAEVGIAEEALGRGVACADVDGDEDLDLYVANWGAPDVLYLNDGKGHFADRTAEAGLGDPGKGRGVCFFDADSDGDADLYLGIEGLNRFYRNLGEGRFAEATEEAGVGDTGMARSVVTADVEGDGDLDLYVVNGDGPNRLYRNRGDGHFEESPDGMGIGDPGPGRSAVFGDIDSDGDPDLYLVNYGQANRLYRNDQANFTEVSEQAGGGDRGKGNGAVFGDLDNDGDLDLVVANEGWPLVYQNQGDGNLAKVAEAAGLVQWGNWVSPVLADFDSDGDLDCYLSNYGGKDALYTNAGSGRFTDHSGDLGRAGGRREFGAAAGDYDGNGTIDLYVVADGLDLLYANASRGNHYLGVEVVGARANRDGIGARVRVLSEGLAQIQEVAGGSGYCSQGSRRLSFGLGGRTAFDSLEVWWPGGERLALAGGTADQLVRIVQSQATAVEETGLLPKPPEWVTLEQNVPNPFNEETAIRFGLPAAGRVKLAIYDIRGQRVRVLIDELVEPGVAVARWNGRDDQRLPVASGIYLCRLTTGKVTQTRKLVLLR